MLVHIDAVSIPRRVSSALRRLLPVVFAVLGVACGGREAPAPTAPQPAPPGWEETKTRAEKLRFEERQPGEAVALLEDVAAKAPGFPDGHFELGDSIRMAAESDVGTPMAEQTPRFERAIGHFRQAMELGYQPRGAAREQIAQIYTRLNRFQDVEQEGRAWVAEEPGSPAAWWTLAGAIVTPKGADEGVRMMLDAGSKIGEAGQVEHAGNLAWMADLPPVSDEQRTALLDAAQAIVDKELAAGRTSGKLTVARVRILQVRARSLERDPSRKRALEDEAERLLTRPNP